MAPVSISMWVCTCWCQVSNSGCLTSDVVGVPVRKLYTVWSACLRLIEASGLTAFNPKPQIFTCTQSLFLHLVSCSLSSITAVLFSPVLPSLVWYRSFSIGLSLLPAPNFLSTFYLFCVPLRTFSNLIMIYWFMWPNITNRKFLNTMQHLKWESSPNGSNTTLKPFKIKQILFIPLTLLSGVWFLRSYSV